MHKDKDGYWVEDKPGETAQVAKANALMRQRKHLELQISMAEKVSFEAALKKTKKVHDKINKNSKLPVPRKRKDRIRLKSNNDRRPF